jgi:deoxyribodipyrimidine photolyase
MEKETGYFLKDSFSDSTDTVREWIKDLKKVVDRYIENPEEWEED